MVVDVIFCVFLLVCVVPLLLHMFTLSFGLLDPPTLASLYAEAHSSQFSKFSPFSHLNDVCPKLSHSLSLRLG